MNTSPEGLTVVTPLTRVGIADQERKLIQVSTAPTGYEGEGFPVKRAFAGIDLSLLDPFLMMDEMGEVDYGPGEPKGTPWHPHRGFETVTYMLEGVFEHRDNQGGGGVIKPGDTQWMTAGDGILHIETPPEWLVQSGGLFHGLQLWVNLPQALKRTAPRYQDIGNVHIRMLAPADGGALVRLIAGRIGPVEGPGSTHTPITLVHATVEPGERLDLPWEKTYNSLAYVIAGRGTVTQAAASLSAGQAAVFGAGDYVSVTNPSRTEKLEVVFLGGEPIAEPVAWAGPFVMNHRHEVLEAYEDFRKGRFALPTA